MVKSDKPTNIETQQVKQVPGKKVLIPAFEKEPDIKLSEINQDLQLTESDIEIVDRICPHYNVLKERYREYRNPDPEGKNTAGFPLKIDRVHELKPFEAVLSQAVMSSIKDTPNRLIKCFVYEGDERKTKMIIDKEVQGEKLNGDPTTIANVRVGYYKYPKQFIQDNDGDWKPVNNRFEKVWYLDWDKEEAEKISLKGNPYTKKYCVWHPDTTLPVNKKYYRREEFFGMSDEEQIKDIENLAKNRQAR